MATDTHGDDGRRGLDGTPHPLSPFIKKCPVVFFKEELKTKTKTEGIEAIVRPVIVTVRNTAALRVA